MFRMTEGSLASAPAATVVATVKWYDPVKGSGFLAPADGSPDVFCHVSAVEGAGYATLPQGATVICEVAEGRRGPVAASILALDASTSSADDEVRDGLRRERGDRRWSRDEAVGPTEARLGLVKFYSATKGYGFVVQDGVGPDVFVHGSVLGRAGLRALEAGQRASEMLEQGARGPQAIDMGLL